MRLRNSLIFRGRATKVSAPLKATIALLLPLLRMACFGGTFAVLGPQTGSWPAVLSSVGHLAGPATAADIFVAPPNTPAAADWMAKVRGGAALILEGSSPLAASFGFRPGTSTVPTLHLVDVHNPALPVIWEKSIEIPHMDVPAGATIFAKERWSGAPVVAGQKLGAGAVLWVATGPGNTGYEHFPYLMQSLAGLGFEPAFRSSQLWAFFDYSYRTRADLDYLAIRWRQAGISALHVASWHFYDPAPDRDEYLKRLIEACHRHGVLVYAWVELPHVSEGFWGAHPEWREKTAVQQDAQLDWRKLMNLQNRDCVAAIRTGLQQMIGRFDWDGVNLAELYFESLEGAGNPARFTPMNDDARAAFRAEAGWDPLEIWGARNDGKSLRQFLDFRAGLARKMQEEWLNTVEGFKSGLDVVLTHVDDRFDTGMKDSIGADASRVLPLLNTHSFSFLIEDPATVWNLGPQRYPEIAKRYQPLTSHPDKLAIDINIVDRYQDVYPTKQQTGAELFQLVHLASTAFPRVALYFENSILKPDLALLAASSAVVTKYGAAKIKDHRRITMESPADIELVWGGDGSIVDGKPWPIHGRGLVRLPAGAHVVETGPKRDGISITDLNAKLKSASVEGKRVSFEYFSDSRGVVQFDRRPQAMEIDGAGFPVTCVDGSQCAVMLPKGGHRVLVN